MRWQLGNNILVRIQLHRNQVRFFHPKLVKPLNEVYLCRCNFLLICVWQRLPHFVGSHTQLYWEIHLRGEMHMNGHSSLPIRFGPPCCYILDSRFIFRSDIYIYIYAPILMSKSYRKTCLVLSLFLNPQEQCNARRAILKSNTMLKLNTWGKPHFQPESNGQVQCSSLKMFLPKMVIASRIRSEVEYSNCNKLCNAFSKEMEETLEMSSS